MTQPDTHGAPTPPRRSVIAGGAGAALGISTLALPSAIAAASGGSISPPAQPSITTSYSSSTDMVTVTYNRTSTSGTLSGNATLYNRGGIAKYDGADPSVSWSDGEFAATFSYARSLLTRAGTVLDADDGFNVYMFIETGGFYAYDNADTASYPEFTNAPTVYITSLQEAETTTEVKEVSSSTSIDVSIDKPGSEVQLDIITLAGVDGEAWAPESLSIEVKENEFSAPEGTLTYLADDGLRAATFFSESPITIPADWNDLTLRIKSSSGTSRLSYTTSTSEDTATGWDNGSIDGQGSEYLRWMIGLRNGV